MRYLSLSGFLGIIAVVGGASAATMISLPPTAVVDTEYQSAAGCQDTGRTVRFGIPEAKYLDLNFKDPRYNIAGISIRETTKVGNSGVRNIKFDPQSGVMAFEIFAGGSGTTQCVPLVGCSCVGASGGSYGVEITAHYLTTKQFQVVE